MNRPDVSHPAPPGTPVSHRPFSPVMVVGGLVLVSGQASVEETGKIVSDTFAGEFHRSIETVHPVSVSASVTRPDCAAAIVQARVQAPTADELPLQCPNGGGDIPQFADLIPDS
jgi:2-iminobutanoate/2-iminopropanoate deaminase